jgi:hypothetical protein
MRYALVATLGAVTLWACAEDGGPPAPYNLTVEGGGGAAVLRWGYDTAAGLDCFLIQRSEDYDYNFVNVAKSPPDKRYYYDGDVGVGKTYYYRVAAFYQEWNGAKDVLSDFSAEVSVQIE